MATFHTLAFAHTPGRNFTCCARHKESLYHLVSELRKFCDRFCTPVEFTTPTLPSASTAQFMSSLLLGILIHETASKTADERQHIALILRSAISKYSDQGFKEALFQRILTTLLSRLSLGEAGGTFDLESLALFSPLPQPTRSTTLFEFLKNLAIQLLEENHRFLKYLPEGEILLNDDPAARFKMAAEGKHRDQLSQRILVFGLLLDIRPGVLKEFAELGGGNGALYYGFIVTNFAHLFQASSPEMGQAGEDLPVGLQVFQKVQAFVLGMVRSREFPLGVVDDSVLEVLAQSQLGRLLKGKKEGLEKRGSRQFGAPPSLPPGKKLKLSTPPTKEALHNVFIRSKESD